MCHDGKRIALVAEEHVEAGEADHHDAEAGRKDVALARAPVDRLVAVQEVDDDEHREIEHAAAHDVADGDVRRIGRGDGADAGRELGQRRDRRHQHQPDPASGQARLVGDDVAVARQLRPGNGDDRGAGQELQPDEQRFVHPMSGVAPRVPTDLRRVMPPPCARTACAVSARRSAPRAARMPARDFRPSADRRRPGQSPGRLEWRFVGPGSPHAPERLARDRASDHAAKPRQFASAPPGRPEPVARDGPERGDARRHDALARRRWPCCSSSANCFACRSSTSSASNPIAGSAAPSCGRCPRLPARRD